MGGAEYVCRAQGCQYPFSSGSCGKNPALTRFSACRRVATPDFPVSAIPCPFLGSWRDPAPERSRRGWEPWTSISWDFRRRGTWCPLLENREEWCRSVAVVQRWAGTRTCRHHGAVICKRGCGARECLCDGLQAGENLVCRRLNITT